MCFSDGKKEDERLYIICISVKGGAPERHKTLIPRIGRRKSVTKQINVLPHEILRPLRLIYCLLVSGDYIKIILKR